MPRSAIHSRLGLAGLTLTACLLAAPAYAAALPTATTNTPAAPSPAANTSSGFVDKSGTDTTPPGTEYALTPKTGDTALQPLIGRVARILVGVSGSIALLVFVWAGITMMRANGDAKLIDKAKKMMIWTTVGLLVIFASEAIIRAVMNALFTGSAT